MRFPELNFAQWNVKSISKIANTIGKPIMMDEPTKLRRRLSYARVLIEVEAEHEFENETQVKMPNQEAYSQTVEYEYISP